MKRGVAVVQIINGNALDELKKLPDGSVDCVITSPPYYGLRSYRGAETIWGGDPNCEHNFEIKKYYTQGQSDKATIDSPSKGLEKKWGEGFCSKCGAWKGQLGLEPTYQMYLGHLLMVTRELKRVLKETGTLFWNMGDTYNGNKIGKTDKKVSDYVKNSMTDLSKNKQTGIQEKSLLMIPERFAIGMIDQGWILRNKIIWFKCLGGNVPIYAKSGGKVIRTIIKDLAKLPIEHLYLPTPQGWKRVLRIEKQPKSELLTIHLRNGFRIEVTSEHRFLIDGKLIEASKMKKGDKLDHANLPDELGTPLGTYENGWCVGLWLAEGNYEVEGKSIRFSFNVKENDLAEKLKAWSEKYAGRYREHNYGNSKTVVISGEVPYAIIRHYTSKAGAKHKRLNGNAFNENNKFLEGVLEGFLAGDGYYDAKNDRYRFALTTNRDLIEDLRVICNRLGFFMRDRLSKTTANNKEYRTFQIEIRKKRTGHFNQKDDFEILKIEKTKGYSYEIEIEAPHIFILPDGTLTHNSNGMPSPVKDRFSNKWEYIFFFVKSKKYYFDLDAVRKPLADPDRMLMDVSGKRHSSAVTLDAFFGNPPKGISKPRPNIKHDLAVNRKGSYDDPLHTKPYNPNGANPGDVLKIPAVRYKSWYSNAGHKFTHERKYDPNADGSDFMDIPTRPHTFAHFAVYPETLIEPLIRAGCPPNGVVLDPFAGSGTTGIVAERLGRNSILIEISSEYIGIINERLRGNPLTPGFPALNP